MAANSGAPGQESRELGVPLTISPTAVPGWGKQRDCERSCRVPARAARRGISRTASVGWGGVRNLSALH
jgi:hypothetical protein